MTNILDMQRDYINKGGKDEDFDESLKEMKKKINIFTFAKGKKGDQLISNFNGIYVFIEFGHEDRVALGETWICLTEMKNGYYYATPLMKLTPGFLVNLDSSIRDSIVNELWQKNRKIFENEFAERYKQEIFESVTAEAESKYITTINGLKQRVAELEASDRNTAFILQNTAQAPVEEEFEMEADVPGQDEEVEMESGDVNISMPAPPRASPMAIPNSRERTMPGFPEMRSLSEKTQTQHVKYIVERTGADTIYSESFTDLKYFIHISPSFDMLVIRPNEFGNAYSINKSITLKGLGNLSPFKIRKILNAEFREKYDGLVVYL